MKAICIRDFTIGNFKFKKGKEYEYDEIIIYVHDCPTSSAPSRMCKGYAVKVGFFSHITCYAKKCISINFGDKNVARWCDAPHFDKYFKTKE